MNVLILHHSKGGNTRRLAECISVGVNEVPDVRVVMRTTKEVGRDDFLGAGAIIAGSPVYFGGMAADLKRVFDDFVGIRKKMENKIGAAFATSGDPSGGKETTMLSIIQCFLIYGMIVVGDPMSATGHYGVACVGPPDSRVAENARLLGKRVAELGQRLR